MADLVPIDRVQPRSRTTCVGWLARFKGADAIQAVCPVPYHAVVPRTADEQEESSYQSSDSQDWLFLSSLSASEVEKPD